jgi:hypothetical protein
MCSLTYPACKARTPHCHLQPLWLHHIFRDYIVNGTIFGKKLSNTTCVFWFLLQLLPKTFLILRRIQRDIFINGKTSSCKVPVILIRFHRNLNFLDTFSGKKKLKYQYFIKIRRMGVALFHTDRRTDMKLTVAFRTFGDAPKLMLRSALFRSRTFKNVTSTWKYKMLETHDSEAL